eukprot:gene12626-3703_t
MTSCPTNAPQLASPLTVFMNAQVAANIVRSATFFIYCRNFYLMQNNAIQTQAAQNSNATCSDKNTLIYVDA